MSKFSTVLTSGHLPKLKLKTELENKLNNKTKKIDSIFFSSNLQIKQK